MPRLWIGIVIASWLLAACGEGPQAPPSASTIPPLDTLPSAVSTDVGLPPTPPPDCVDDAAFVADLSLPDGSQAAPGEQLVKQWSVQNTGECDWGPGYRLIPALPNPLAGSTPIALYPARAGTLAVWQVSVLVPEASGEIIGRWQAQDPDGRAFGEEVYVVLEVTAATAAPAVEASATP